MTFPRKNTVTGNLTGADRLLDQLDLPTREEWAVERDVQNRNLSLDTTRARVEGTSPIVFLCENHQLPINSTQ